MNRWQRFTGHLSTITRHRHLVLAHCMRCGLFWQGIRHDLSKYSPQEFWPGVRYFDGHHSPNEDERRAKGYSAAWIHHKGRNPHHWEYWTDYNAGLGRYAAVPMPRRYLAEMVCDRMAASKVYRGSAYTDGDPLGYLMRGKAKDAMNPRTVRELRYFLELLRDEGEEAMFVALRKWLKEEISI